VNCALKLVETLDECATLGRKIEDTLSRKIHDASMKMAEEILANPQIESITEVVRKHVMTFGADIASIALNDVAAKASLPSASQSKGKRQRTLSTILGPVSYERQAFYDSTLKNLTFPADDFLGIKGGQLQADILSRMVKAGIEMPFSEAADLCESLMGVRVSEGSLYNAVISAGTRAKYENVVPSREEIHRKLDNLKKTNPEESVHIVIGVDGAMEPLRPSSSKRAGARGECFWKECKGFRAYAIVGEKTLEQLVSWHQICDDEELGRYLRLLSSSLQGRSEPLVIVADGARWIWKQISEAFNTQIEILDWYHAVEHLAQFADLQFGKCKEKKRDWLEKSKERLMHDSVSGVIGSLSRMNFANVAAETCAQTLKSYLKSNQSRMRYGTFKKMGLSIGSGGMESANKSISHIRLKRNGCWWKQIHANEVLRLRCAKANGTLDRHLATCWHPADLVQNTECQANDL